MNKHIFIFILPAALILFQGEIRNNAIMTRFNKSLWNRYCFVQLCRIAFVCDLLQPNAIRITIAHIKKQQDLSGVEEVKITHFPSLYRHI